MKTKRNKGEISFRQFVAILAIGLPGGYMLGWFLYNIVGLGR